MLSRHALLDQLSMTRLTCYWLFLTILRLSYVRPEGKRPFACPSSHPDAEVALGLKFCYVNCRSGYNGRGQEFV